MTHSDIDWNSIWIEKQKKNMNSGRGGGCPQAWMSYEAARQYWQRSMSGYAANERLDDLCSMVQPHWQALDIGAGPGNFAIPLAQKISHITAVEPADGMAAVMQEEISKHNINNIDIVQKKWDDVDIKEDLSSPYQLTYASYSLGMLDLKAAIQKMQAVTTQTILLCWHAGSQPYDNEAEQLWQLLHQKPFYPIPKSDIVFNVLYQMGIYPHIEPVSTSNTISYPSFDDAMKDYCCRYDVQTAEQENLIRKHLENRLDQKNGSCTLTNRHNGFKIWWSLQKDNKR